MELVARSSKMQFSPPQSPEPHSKAGQRDPEETDSRAEVSLTRRDMMEADGFETDNDSLPAAVDLDGVDRFSPGGLDERTSSFISLSQSCGIVGNNLDLEAAPSMEQCVARSSEMQLLVCPSPSHEQDPEAGQRCLDRNDSDAESSLASRDAADAILLQTDDDSLAAAVDRAIMGLFPFGDTGEQPAPCISISQSSCGMAGSVSATKSTHSTTSTDATLTPGSAPDVSDFMVGLYSPAASDAAPETRVGRKRGRADEESAVGSGGGALVLGSYGKDNTLGGAADDFSSGDWLEDALKMLTQRRRGVPS